MKKNTFNLRNITINNKAVYSSRTSVELNDYGIRYSAFNSLYTARLQPDIISQLSPTVFTIDAITIDEYVEENHLKPSFVKVDAEGAEYQILLGMENTIMKLRPIISLEVGVMNVKYITPSRELVNFMINKGYKAYEYDEGIKLHLIKDTPYQPGNILFLPN